MTEVTALGFYVVKDTPHVHVRAPLVQKLDSAATLLLAGITPFPGWLRNILRAPVSGVFLSLLLFTSSLSS